jgi:hypothetical protein
MTQTKNRSIADTLASIHDAADRAMADMLDPRAARTALADAAALLTLLDVRAYPLDDETDDTLEQVVVTVHGVDVSVRGRSGDLFVHVDDLRDDLDRRALPLAVEVNNSGEMTYGQLWDGADTTPLCEGCGDLPATDLTLMRCSGCLGNGRRRRP